ncbi:MAG: succinate--CoA ligase subunit alpha [Acidobacteria bacterium]|nr:succinate--CoA ligase subunit alpha [Acidobacteriota bacterium]
MTILIDGGTRLAIQGITGREGSFHARQCVEYGTNVVAGVTPGKGGTLLDGIPVFHTVEEAVKQEGATATLIFVPAAHGADAILEAAAAGVGLIICITEGIPTQDMARVMGLVEGSATRLIGPNCPGVISPGKCKAGIMPGRIFREGHVGVISRSGTLTYEAVHQLSMRGIGQSTCIGIGGDPVIGTRFVDALELFERDPDTHAVVMVGEIGGTAEEEAARYIKENMTKPVVGFIAGRTAPPGRRMGHAGAIISGGKGTAAEKMEALERSGVRVVSSPADIGEAMEKLLNPI